MGWIKLVTLLALCHDPIFQLTDPFCRIVELGCARVVNSILQAWQTSLPIACWSKGIQTNPIDSSLDIRSESSLSHVLHCVETDLPSKGSFL
jgi:hypothetical protein